MDWFIFFLLCNCSFLTGGQVIAQPHVLLPQSRLPSLGSAARPPVSLTPTYYVRGIPDVMQMNNYSCGVGVFQAAAMYFGHWGYQSEFAKALGTTSADGTHPMRITQTLRKMGMDAELVEGMTLEKLKERLMARDMVIIDYQAWSEKPEGKDYSHEWEDGHYSIVTGFNDDVLFIEDPCLLGTIGYLTNDEFLSRWHDYETENGKRRNYVHMVILVRGKVVPQPRYTHID